MMHLLNFKTYTPHPALQHLIRKVVVLESKYLKVSAQSDESIYFPTPDESIYIHINTRFLSRKFDQNQQRLCSHFVVVTPQITPTMLSFEDDHIAIGVHFHPGGLYQFLGIPITEISNDGFDGEDLLGNEIKEFIEKCHDKQNDFGFLNTTVQQFFLQRLYKMKERLPVDVALSFLMTHHNASIDQAASIACLSPRQFERKCKERLGMPPKVYARLSRFFKAFHQIDTSKNTPWTDIVYGLGYYDQMHFIKDFKDFTGHTPNGIKTKLEEINVRFQLEWDKL
jgi:AraC-like DNA-binding protein